MRECSLRVGLGELVTGLALAHAQIKKLPDLTKDYYNLIKRGIFHLSFEALKR